jgi:HIV Tat-specific factor 1
MTESDSSEAPSLRPLFAPPETLSLSTPFSESASSAIRKLFDEKDERVYFDKQSGNWRCEIEGGDEVEWNAQRQAWVPVLDDDAFRAQQAAYSVDGVDEEVRFGRVLQNIRAGVDL